jgi:hypothetical protein
MSLFRLIAFTVIDLREVFEQLRKSRRFSHVTLMQKLAQSAINLIQVKSSKALKCIAHFQILSLLEQRRQLRDNNDVIQTLACFGVKCRAVFDNVDAREITAFLFYMKQIEQRL